MKSMERLLLVMVPLLALTAFIVVRKQYGEIVPAPPTTVEQEDAIAVSPVPPAPEMTVLEARAVDDDESLPPGIEPVPTMTPPITESAPANPIIVIPDPSTGSVNK